MKMSLSLRKLSSKTKLTINDLPDEVLLLIFKRCQPVACYRSRQVCQRWRKTIDSMEEESRKEAIGGGHARLYISDRRRAILEKFSCPPSCSNSVRDLTARRKTEFHEDRYAHTALNSWAYRFDLTEWAANFDITEVWLQNFGSFLERDSFGDAQMYLQDSNNSVAFGQNKNGSFGATPPLQTTPSRHMGRSPTSHRSGGSSGSLGNPGLVPYNLLPSSQQASMESVCGPMDLNEEMYAELSDLSAGRFERLAMQLRSIQPLHIVFNDHSFYQKRPTLLLFWFLKQLTNLRKLTLDCVQGDQCVELHRVLSLQGIDELTVIQPQQKICIIVNENLLNAFLNVDRAERRRFRLRFKGKTALTAESLCNFIKKWQNHRDVIAFHSILVDALSVRPADFVRAAMYPGDSNNNEVHKDELDTAVLNTKQLAFRHRKSNIRIRYKYEDGYLVFSYFDPKLPVVRRTQSESDSVPKVVTFYSPTPTSSDSESNEESDIKQPGEKAFEEENLFRRFFGMILRSTA